MKYIFTYNCKHDSALVGFATAAGQAAWRGLGPATRGIVCAGGKGRREVRELGDRIESFVGVRRHRREQGAAERLYVAPRANTSPPHHSRGMVAGHDPGFLVIGPRGSLPFTARDSDVPRSGVGTNGYLVSDHNRG